MKEVVDLFGEYPDALLDLSHVLFDAVHGAPFLELIMEVIYQTFASESDNRNDRELLSLHWTHFVYCRIHF